MTQLPPKVRVAVAICMVGALVLISLAFLALAGLLMLRMSGLVASTNSVDPRNAVTVFGVSLAMMCGILWIASVAEVIKLSQNVEKRLWRALIVGILAAVVGAVAMSLKK